MSEPTTVERLLNLGERVLADSTHIFDDHDNRAEAEELMAHVLGIATDEFDAGEMLPRRQRESFLALIARRAGGEPFPFLVGRITFYGLDLKVRPGAFVPRPSSELTVERAVKRAKGRKSPVIVDVCTGAGPIALAIADDLASAEVWGTDIQDEGLRFGRENAKLLGIKNVRFKRGDMYGSLPRRLEGKVDVITGHVPYVPPEEVDDLPAEVKDFEPIFTLSDLSIDGLGLMRAAVSEAPHWLKPGGWLLLEMSDDLVKKVSKMCAKAGLEDISVADDDDDLSVVVEARKPR